MVANWFSLSISSNDIVKPKGGYDDALFQGLHLEVSNTLSLRQPTTFGICTTNMMIPIFLKRMDMIRYAVAAWVFLEICSSKKKLKVKTELNYRVKMISKSISNQSNRWHALRETMKEISSKKNNNKFIDRTRQKWRFWRNKIESISNIL